MSDWSRVVEALAWSMGGFAVGFYVGRLWYVEYRSREFVVEQQEERRTGEDRRQEDRRVLGARGWSTNRVIGITLIVLALASVVAGVVAIQRWGGQTECNTAFREAIAERTQLANQDRMAQVDLATANAEIMSFVAKGIADPPDFEDPAERKAYTDEFVGTLDNYLGVVADFQDQIAKSDQQRAENPLPTVSEACG